MKNLLEQVQKRTQENIVKKATKKNICDSMHEILFDGKQELSRVDIIAMITVERLKEIYPNLKDSDTLNDEQIRKVNSINITVKNGLDTAVCNGSTSSSYCSNPKYKNYKLVKTGDKLKIVERKQNLIRPVRLKIQPVLNGMKTDNLIKLIMATIGLAIILVALIAGAVYNTVRYGIEVFRK